MGVGNVLVKSKSAENLLNRVEEIGLKDSIPVRTKDVGYWLIAYSDCASVITCSGCGVERCVGCNHQFLLDLDKDEAKCTDCLGQNIFQLLAGIWTPGRGDEVEV